MDLLIILSTNIFLGYVYCSCPWYYKPKMDMTWFALGQLTVLREWALRLVTAEVLQDAMRSQWNKQ